MLITGCPPFDGEDNKKIMEKIKIGIFDKNNINYKNASFEVKDLISKLLVIDPNKRLTANQALQHPWLNKTKSNILYYNISKDEILKCIQNILSYNIKSRYEEIVLAYIVHNLPQQKEIKTIIKLFKIINKKGDGKLDKKELKYGLLNFVSDNYLKNLDEIFNLLDGEKRGYIEYEEFLRAGLDRKQILTEENLKYAFNFFDKENNGYITKDRMKIFFVKPIIDEELYNRTFDEIDKNKDGKIDYQEFKDMMLYN
jgi:calcium-dependent protein kinase